MIVPMKKVSIVVLDSIRRKAMRVLEKMGVMHVATERHAAPAPAAEIDSLNEALQKIRRSLAIVREPAESANKKKGSGSSGSGAQVTAMSTTPASEDELLQLADDASGALIRRSDEIRGLRDRLERLEKEASRLAPWGDFNPDDIRTLAERGVLLRIYSLGPDDFSRFPDHYARVILHRSRNLVRCAVLVDADRIGPDGELPDDLDDFAALEMPEMRLSEIQEEIEQGRRRIGEIGEEIAAFGTQIPILEAAFAVLEQRLEFETVLASMDEDDRLASLTGYVPADRVDDLRSAAGDAGWALLIRDPDADDPVPTQTKNPRAIGIIKPVFGLLGTTPGYRELDISFFFLLFFIVFFAMIIGDGGYGLVLLIGSIFGLISSKKKNGRVGDGAILLTVLSVATIAWGALTGTWFGAEAIAELPVLRDLRFDPIYSFNTNSARWVQLFCFILGTVHLSIAHIWNFIREIREKPAIKAFAQLGWLSMLLGLYYLVLNVVLAVLGWGMPDFALYMIIGGLAFVLIFSEQQEGRNFFVGVGKGVAGLMTTFLDSISAFSDIISYIRLFAVGLASVEIAKSFNAMASPAIEGGGFGIVAGILILFLGHTLNLAMGFLSVIVHGVRLNMLEFSGHLGLEWAGTPFRPFGRTDRE